MEWDVCSPGAVPELGVKPLPWVAKACVNVTTGKLETTCQLPKEGYCIQVTLDPHVHQLFCWFLWRHPPRYL